MNNIEVSEIFVNWAKSINFRREEQNYVVQNNIDNMAVITSDIVAHKVCNNNFYARNLFRIQSLRPIVRWRLRLKLYRLFQSKKCSQTT